MPVSEQLYITPKAQGVPVVCDPAPGLPPGVNLSSACVLFGTPTAAGVYYMAYLYVSNYVVRC